MKLIKHTYWKIFFAAYWLAYELGEKNNPQRNASWFIEVTFMINLFSLLFIANFIYGEKLAFYKAYLVFSMIFTFAFNEYILFSNKQNFNNQLKQFDYFAKPENKKNRNKIIFLVFMLTVLVMIVSMSINNPFIKHFFFNM